MQFPQLRHGRIQAVVAEGPAHLSIAHRLQQAGCLVHNGLRAGVDDLGVYPCQDVGPRQQPAPRVVGRDRHVALVLGSVHIAGRGRIVRVHAALHHGVGHSAAGAAESSTVPSGALISSRLPDIPCCSSLPRALSCSAWASLLPICLPATWPPLTPSPAISTSVATRKASAGMPVASSAPLAPFSMALPAAPMASFTWESPETCTPGRASVALMAFCTVLARNSPFASPYSRARCHISPEVTSAPVALAAKPPAAWASSAPVCTTREGPPATRSARAPSSPTAALPVWVT